MLTNNKINQFDLDVEFVINSALADDGASFASKHIVMIVFVHDSLYNMEVLMT